MLNASGSIRIPYTPQTHSKHTFGMQQHTRLMIRFERWLTRAQSSIYIFNKDLTVLTDSFLGMHFTEIAVFKPFCFFAIPIPPHPLIMHIIIKIYLLLMMSTSSGNQKFIVLLLFSFRIHIVIFVFREISRRYLKERIIRRANCVQLTA